MNTLEAIFSRKSVRKFTGDVTAEQMDTLLKAAYAAPIGRAQYDSVHLTVIRDGELLSKIDRAGAELFGNPALTPLYCAPVFVLVSAQAPVDNVGFSNCATVVENMALAAVELGLGACHIWGATIALGRKPELVAQLKLPEGFVPCCGLILGQTEESYAQREIPAGRIRTSFL